MDKEPEPETIIEEESDDEEFEELAAYFKVPKDKRHQFLRNAKEDTFPERAASNPERRAERVRELASKAPDRQTEKRKHFLPSRGWADAHH